jgi:glycosyltransferase involved in cell wall biosynthesis
MEYSIVIPAHNEAPNLERFVSSFLHKLSPGIAPTEVLLVENGSTDGTLAACDRLAKSFPGQVRVLSLGRPSYGEAIKQGILQARGSHLSILEVDCLDVDFVADSIRLFEKERAQFIVASKRHPESIDRRPLKRRVLTFLYNFFFLRLILGYPGTDTHGLKSMEASCGRELCELAITTDEIFQTEIVLLAWRLGIEIQERPLRIREARRAPVAVFKRLPKVWNTVRQLQRSLRRFPEKAPALSTTVVN